MTNGKKKVKCPNCKREWDWETEQACNIEVCGNCIACHTDIGCSYTPTSGTIAVKRKSELEKGLHR